MIARDGSSAPRMHQKSVESEARGQQASSSRAPHASRQRDHVEDLHEEEHQRAPRSQALKILRRRSSLAPSSMLGPVHVYEGVDGVGALKSPGAPDANNRAFVR